MNDDGPVTGIETTAVVLECNTPPEKASRPRWLNLFLGREVLRVCPYAHKDEPCQGCRLRVLCRCAQENLAAAAVVERRVWVVLAICGGLSILYAAFAFIHSR